MAGEGTARGWEVGRAVGRGSMPRRAAAGLRCDGGKVRRGVGEGWSGRVAGLEWRWGRDSGWGGTGGGPGGLIPGIEAVDVGPEEDLHSIGILWVRPIHGFGGVEPGTGSAERGGIPVARLTSGPIGVSQSGALPEWLEAFGIGPVAGRSWERDYPSRLVGGHDATLRGGCFPVPTVDGG